MEIKELLKMQEELDQYIVDMQFNTTEEGLAQVDGNDMEFLANRLLALQVEVSELANATRCFKYWSSKGMEPKERLLDEYADCMHFMFSIANTLKFTADEIENAYIKKHKENYRRQEEGY
ncbi:dUTPase [Clostridium tepidiprofundi DSM 19306]|uniref:dUTPase n=1 Tax=Clostridium tepidiprofundi DSM 19306 TaxID=1121338 RepID=A0A151B879_9CLOT|nr:dUTPase [Clostridium tepidiprofundi]KYH35857.1 dUTPase [Clostridium tepidiprofundi DSM 19306]